MIKNMFLCNSKKILFFNLILFSTISSILGSCDCLQPEKLFPSSVAQHGAGVRSVGWCCNGEIGPFAAIAGLRNDEEIVLRIYDIQTNKLHELANTTGNHLYSLDWCCGTTAYLAVGGLADQSKGNAEVHLYSFDGSTLSYLASFTHGAPVNSVAWLCDCCDEDELPLLAIGGQTSSIDNIEVRILRFERISNTLTVVGNAVSGAEIFSVDWCCRTNRQPILAAAGKKSFGCGSNINTYCVDCVTGNLTPLSNATYPGEVVHTARWCSDPTLTFPFLIVGGRKYTENPERCVNFELYALQPAPTNQLEKVDEGCKECLDDIFAADWVPNCKCNYVAIGGGCPVCSEECLDNIFVLKRNICQLESTTATNYDTNITSLAWCKINSCAYLLAGTESENICDNLKEIILYKAAFCNPVEPTPFICQR